MWLFLWIFFAFAIIGGFCWSYHVLYEQKRAWNVFAKKYNLEFAKGTFFEPPSAAGQIKGRQVNLYTQQKINDQTRTSSNQTVVEVFLNDLPGTTAVVTSAGFMDFMESVGLPAPFIVEDPKWPANILARTFEDERPDLWFLENSKRVEAIQTLSKMPFDIGFVTDADRAFVVVRTSLPLTDPKRINQILGQLFKAAELLETTSAPDKSAEPA